ncbi:hypothetical protein CBR_g32037 [Chara braunii]|uniref:mannan endo-1,4-beta-mannosidase n=1 Tax=Chara braunii TaxID=69332 RepID=A0A388LGD1_CHABU|nr:hypothetical protein CBR_g32037 [Chara braunii]|eukprot:GBG81364.1 hypothetical protein CBR_g32037 [Chara braunii]
MGGPSEVLKLVVLFLLFATSTTHVTGDSGGVNAGEDDAPHHHLDPVKGYSASSLFSFRVFSSATDYGTSEDGDSAGPRGPSPAETASGSVFRQQGVADGQPRERQPRLSQHDPANASKGGSSRSSPSSSSSLPEPIRPSLTAIPSAAAAADLLPTTIPQPPTSSATQQHLQAIGGGKGGGGEGGGEGEGGSSTRSAQPGEEERGALEKGRSIMDSALAKEAEASDMAAAPNSESEEAEEDASFEQSISSSSSPPSSSSSFPSSLTEAQDGYDPRQHWGIVRPKGMLFDAGDGSNFLVNGWNTRDIMFNALTEDGKKRVSKVFYQARLMGLTVVRIMACNDGRSRTVQRGPLTFDESVLAGLDWVMNEASLFGIRLVLTLAGNWESKEEYLEWYKTQSNDDDATPDLFYTDPSMKSWYRALVDALLKRRNTVNGRLFKDDPTVFAWQVMNEPRCTSDVSGATLISWLTEMVAYIKSLDDQHMVSLGVEGFYGPSDPRRAAANPNGGGWATRQGNDFLLESQIPGVDYLTLHLYPQLWVYGKTTQEQMFFASAWIRSHVLDNAEKFKMPLIIEEFGWKSADSIDNRNAFFEVVFGESLEASKRGLLAGTMFWALEDSEGFFSDWGVYYERDTATTVPIITAYSTKINKLMN